MHDFGSGFQLDTKCHIYRGLGKSELWLVFLNVPYERRPEIGAMDGDFDTFYPGASDEVSIFSRDDSPTDTGLQESRLWNGENHCFPAENPVVLSRFWQKMSIFGTFRTLKSHKIMDFTKFRVLLILPDPLLRAKDLAEMCRKSTFSDTFPDRAPPALFGPETGFLAEMSKSAILW